MVRIGQNCIYTPPYMTVYLAIVLSKIPYIHPIGMVLANPSHDTCRKVAVCTVKMSFGLRATDSVLVAACCSCVRKVAMKHTNITRNYYC